MSLPSSKYSSPVTQCLRCSDTRNYLAKDPILDWLDLYGRERGFVSDRDAVGYDRTTDMLLFLNEKTSAFRQAVVQHLGAQFDLIEIDREITDEEARHRATIAAIEEGREIVARPLLRDESRHLEATPSLLVRNDILARIACRPVQRLNVDDPRHYRVVDIKYTTLPLDRKGCIGNDGSMRARKVQAWMANRLLASMQGYEPDAAHVIGRGWKKGDVRGSDCFDEVGTYDLRDEALGGQAEEAIAWLRRVRDQGAAWSVLPAPSVPELYPNMGNLSDAPWHLAKKQIAEEICELSLMWYVTGNNRAGALDEGIVRFDDERCHARLFGLSDDRTAILQAILDVNRGDALVAPPGIECEASEWREPAPLEFYVDFETVSDLDDDLSGFPQKGGQALIFMIGCGHIEAGKWVFRVFTCDRLTEDCEREMIEAWLAHMSEVRSRIMPIGDPLVFHWSHAETATLDTAYNSARKRLKADWPTLRWFDFLSRVIRKQPVVAKGSWTFGLKSVARAMHGHGLIETEWTNGPGDGLQAMVGAWRCDAIARNGGGSMRDLPLMQSIEEYNEVDCRVMWEIISYLRANH